MVHRDGSVVPERDRNGGVWRGNSLFLTVVALSCLGLGIVAFRSVLGEFVTTSTGLDLTPFLGTIDQNMPGRNTLPRLFKVWLFLAGALYLFCWPNRHGRVLRTWLLGLAFLHNFTLVLAHRHVASAQTLLGELDSGALFERQGKRLQRLKIIELPGTGLSSFQWRKQLRQQDINTFSDLHTCVMQEYNQRAVWLRQQWAISDEQKLKALFIMNFVAGLWGFGNQVAVEQTGCVLCNEKNRWVSPPLNVRAYLNADIGCCTDFAYLSKTLLDHEGIENRLTAIPGHLFNEVRLGGEWCVLDASANLFIEEDWKDLYVKHKVASEGIRILLFPHPGLANEASPSYRPLAGHFRLMTLLRVANRPTYLQKTQYQNLPNHFN